jgi:hypothetical protein
MPFPLTPKRCDEFKPGDTIMFAKTSIALAIIVAICSGAVAAEKRQNGAANAYGRSAPVFVQCAPGVWDAYGLRCDSAE